MKTPHSQVLELGASSNLPARTTSGVVVSRPRWRNTPSEDRRAARPATLMFIKATMMRIKLTQSSAQLCWLSTLAQLPVLLFHRYIHVVRPAVAAAVPFPRALLVYAAILMAALQDVRRQRFEWLTAGLNFSVRIPNSNFAERAAAAAGASTACCCCWRAADA
eukprot:1153463-Pelagomonas_calceolata.AAC.2